MGGVFHHDQRCLGKLQQENHLCSRAVCSQCCWLCMDRAEVDANNVERHRKTDPALAASAKHVESTEHIPPSLVARSYALHIALHRKRLNKAIVDRASSHSRHLRALKSTATSLNSLSRWTRLGIRMNSIGHAVMHSSMRLSQAVVISYSVSSGAH